MPTDALLVVAGDFNDWRKQAHKVLDGSHMHEVFERANGALAKTFPARLPFLSLDRIYVRNAASCAPVVMPSKPWSHLSDHAPLTAVIQL
jgi:endonuclease/exonuclease/phosphatase family metal-dependent hydrolase